MSWLAFLIVIAALAVIAAFIAYGAWCFVIAPAIGRTAGAIDRRRRPITEQERRAIATADERAARDSVRPWGSVDGLSTVHAPIGTNGHHETPAS